MRLFFITATLLSTLFLTPAYAFEVVVPIDHFPPWKVVKGDRISGIDIELTKALLAEIGATPKFVICPWSRCLEMLKNGQGDLLSGVLVRPERANFLAYIYPPYKTRSSKVFYRLMWSPDIKTHEDLSGRAIGTQRGANYFPRFDSDTSLTKEEVHTDELNFRKLRENRVDAIITTESQGDYIVATLGFDKNIVKSTYRYDEVIPVHFAVSRRSALFDKIQELTTAAEKLKKDGTFAAIIKQYFRDIRETQ